MQNHDLRTSRLDRKSVHLISKLKALGRNALGISVETDLFLYRDIVPEIKSRALERYSVSGLRELSVSLASQVGSGVPLENLLVEAFALVREASRRAIGLDPFDVQMIAGLAMAQGKIAELPTGEGKTLAAVFPAHLYALTGRGVHILTFNDYLARRDAAWMGPIFRLLGQSVGCVQEGQKAEEKKKAYACDITYATAKEAGFDFLRDEICYEQDDLVHRTFHMALVDEADSILIDEARIPLVISGVEERTGWDAGRLAAAVKAMSAGRDYETDVEHRNVFLTDSGIERAETMLGCGSLYDPKNQPLLEALYCALHAEALLRRDVDYIVRSGRIEIVDEFTGRVVDNRHWPDGLQAAVEAKEKLDRKSEARILGSITLQHFFRLYPKLCGMTATARPSAAELKEFYDLKVVVVPPHKPSIRMDHPDAVFTHKEAKRRALKREIQAVHEAGRPILVGTANVKESEELASDLTKAGISCHVLNAKNDEREAGIIAQAGLPGAITISTNMAGRGTDIKLGGADERERERVVALGGLYVIGTNRYESLRIDQQLRGRAGRQGDPGSTRFFISLEDDLFERYGLVKLFYKRHRLQKQETPLSQGEINREIGHAQRIIEGQNFDIRRSLWKFSSLGELQRRTIHNWRALLFFAQDSPLLLSARNPELYERGLSRFGRTTLEGLERRATIFQIDRFWSDHLAWINDTRETIHLVSLGGRTPIHEFQKSSTAAFLELRNNVETAVVHALEAMIGRDGPVDVDAEGLRGPSSTWTYLINEDQFGWGMEMLKGQNIGFSSAAAALYGPLFILALMANKIFGRKSSK